MCIEKSRVGKGKIISRRQSDLAPARVSIHPEKTVLFSFSLGTAGHV